MDTNGREDVVYLWNQKMGGIKCAPISESEFGAETRELERRLVHTMLAYKGCGLAASQVGLWVRAAVAEYQDQRVMMFNPEIVDMKGEEKSDWEGCLSMPGCSSKGNIIHNQGRVARSHEVTYTYQDAEGKTNTRTDRGWMARIIQHEMDHMDGVFFIDRTSPIYREKVLRNLHNFQKRISALRTTKQP